MNLSECIVHAEPAFVRVYQSVEREMVDSTVADPENWLHKH